MRFKNNYNENSLNLLTNFDLDRVQTLYSNLGIKPLE